MKSLTTEETKTVKSLIRLGDSKALAVKTVIENRKDEDSREIYILAYER